AFFPDMGQLLPGSPGEDLHAGKWGELTPSRQRGGGGWLRLPPPYPLTEERTKKFRPYQGSRVFAGFPGAHAPGYSLPPLPGLNIVAAPRHVARIHNRQSNALVTHIKRLEANSTGEVASSRSRMTCIFYDNSLPDNADTHENLL
ncbi:MAG TPA: hypothetical protein VGH74_21960, partial [Planctomycetaceae bacterium]